MTAKARRGHEHQWEPWDFNEETLTSGILACSVKRCNKLQCMKCKGATKTLLGNRGLCPLCENFVSNKRDLVEYPWGDERKIQKELESKGLTYLEIREKRLREFGVYEHAGPKRRI